MKIIKLLITVYLLLFTTSTALAVDSATDSSLTDKIKERLEKTAEEGVDKIKEDLITKTKLPRPKAYVGLIKNIGKDSLTLEYKSQTYTIYADSDTLIFKSGQKLNKLENLQIDNYILSLGFFYPEKNAFIAKRINIVTAPQSLINRQLLIGKIEEIDTNKVVVDGKKLTLTAKTKLVIKDIKDPTVEDLELKDNLFAIVTFDKSGNISEAKNALILPGKNNPASQAPTNATESASPSATIN